MFIVFLKLLIVCVLLVNSDQVKSAGFTRSIEKLHYMGRITVAPQVQRFLSTQKIVDESDDSHQKNANTRNEKSSNSNENNSGWANWRESTQKKWKESAESPTFFVRCVQAGSAVALSQIGRDFLEQQEKRRERQEFINKTHDYLMPQIEANKNTIAYLYSEAESKQTRLELFCTPEEKVKRMRLHKLKEQEINMALGRVNHLLEENKKIPDAGRFDHRDYDGSHYLKKDLEYLRSDLNFALLINKILLLIDNDAFNLAEQHITRLINEYNQNDNAQGDKERIAVFYNLRGLLKFRLLLGESDKDTYEQKALALVKSDFNQAKLYNPNNHYSYIHEAYIYRSIYLKGKKEKFYLDQFKDLVYQAYQIAPNEPSTLNTVGLYKRAIGEDFKARIFFAEALNLRPDNPIILCNMAKVNLVLGDQEKDTQYYHQALEISEKAIIDLLRKS